MYPVQLAPLVAEVFVMALLVFGMFCSRASAGRSPLYVVLGAVAACHRRCHEQTCLE